MELYGAIVANSDPTKDFDEQSPVEDDEDSHDVQHSELDRSIMHFICIRQVLLHIPL